MESTHSRNRSKQNGEKTLRDKFVPEFYIGEHMLCLRLNGRFENDDDEDDGDEEDNE